jgi:YggT family protein
MSRERNNPTNDPRNRTRDGVRFGDGRRDPAYEPNARPAPAGPSQDAELEPTRIEVERRGGTERRVVEEPVDVERRQRERRAAREQEQIEARERRHYVVARATQAVDYLFILLYGLLGIRFVLGLLGASQQAGFVQFINGITNPFYAPFANIVTRPSVNGGVLDFPLLIAVLAYALLHLAVRGLLRLFAGARTVP